MQLYIFSVEKRHGATNDYVNWFYNNGMRKNNIQNVHCGHSIRKEGKGMYPNLEEKFKSNCVYQGTSDKEYVKQVLC